ncbi:MAG: hypothetical protein O2878_08640 [Bacteroidetes bacterium]|nr:hypothetical protein [Bacteroidota bacterium]
MELKNAFLLVVICFCFLIGYSYADEVFTHKDWSVTTYDSDPEFIKYSTHGSAVWGHEFGFLKIAGSCDEDNIFVSWSSTVKIDQLKKMEDQKVLFDLQPDEQFFQFAVPNLGVNPLFGSEDLEIPNSLNVMVFANYLPQVTFNPSLEVGRKISVKVNEKDPHHSNFDIPDDEFSLVGYIAARQFATEQCEIRTQALKIKDQYKITMR